MLAVGLIATATVLLVGRDDEGVEIATNGDRASECGIAPPVDLTVTFDPAATTPEFEAVERALANSPAVTGYSFQSREEGIRIFQCVYADEPETLAGADLARLPAVFLVDVEAGADPSALVRNVEAEPGVKTALRTCSAPVDLEVFMVVGPTEEQLATARRVIEQAAGVSEVRCVSKEDAYREFSCLFSDQPDLVQATTSEALPPSFRVMLQPGADHRALIQQFETLDGVDAVSDTRYSVIVPIPGLDADEVGPRPPGT